MIPLCCVSDQKVSITDNKEPRRSHCPSTQNGLFGELVNQLLCTLRIRTHCEGLVLVLEISAPKLNELAEEVGFILSSNDSMQVKVAKELDRAIHGSFDD